MLPIPGITFSLGDKTQHEKLPYLSHKRLLFTLVEIYLEWQQFIGESEWAQAKITNKTPKLFTVYQNLPNQSLTSL